MFPVMGCRITARGVVTTTARSASGSSLLAWATESTNTLEKTCACFLQTGNWAGIKPKKGLARRQCRESSTRKKRGFKNLNSSKLKSAVGNVLNSKTIDSGNAREESTCDCSGHQAAFFHSSSSCKWSTCLITGRVR
jgi:hypothetical protein